MRPKIEWLMHSAIVIGSLIGALYLTLPNRHSPIRRVVDFPVIMGLLCGIAYLPRLPHVWQKVIVLVGVALTWILLLQLAPIIADHYFALILVLAIALMISFLPRAASFREEA
jgi:hypothetical protein